MEQLTKSGFLLLISLFSIPLLSNGWTSLHYAAFHGNVEIIKELIEEKKIDIETTTDNGDTPLHIACSEGNLPAIKCLITRGAKINATNKKLWTPLHKAAYRGDGEIIAYLITCGADTTATNCDKRTPFEIACLHNRESAIRALVCNGAVIMPASVKLPTDKNLKTYLTTMAQFFNLTDTAFEKQVVDSLKVTDQKAAKKTLNHLLRQSASRDAPLAKRLYDTICKNFTPEERTAFGFNYTDVKYFYRDMANYTKSPFMKEQWRKRSKEDFSLSKNLNNMVVPGYLKSKIKSQKSLGMPNVTVSIDKADQAKQKLVDVTVWTLKKNK